MASDFSIMETGMLSRLFFCAFLFVSIVGGTCWGQTLDPAPAPSSPPVSISLAVPEGTPLPIVLDKEVRIHKVGQPIHGKIAEPVYAFDKLVIPAGSQVTGKVIGIASVSAQKRTLAALNANFSPYRDVQISFYDLILPDGRRVPLQTVVSLASQGVLQFAASADTANQSKGDKKSAAKKLASTKVSETRQEINRNWETAKKQVKAPGKLHRLERFAIAQLPYHPQYLDAGTRYNAELKLPLDFGTEALSPEMLQTFGSAPPPGSVVHALLLTPLSSATAQKSDAVEAVITAPLMVSNQLIFPEGTRLEGSVLQVRPARRLKRNGQLRIVFHQVVPPNAAQQNVEASLDGVEVKDQENLSLDSEGGARVTTPKTRYLTTGISIALAASSFSPDADAGRSVQQSGGEMGGRAVNGASGFRVIGILLGVFVHSRVFASSMGVYGAGMSVYYHFLTRGSDVVYPKDTAMAIGFGSRVVPVPAGKHAL
jgi:hypothetical protein